MARKKYRVPVTAFIEVSADNEHAAEHYVDSWRRELRSSGYATIMSVNGPDGSARPVVLAVGAVEEVGRLVSEV